MLRALVEPAQDYKLLQQIVQMFGTSRVFVNTSNCDMLHERAGAAPESVRCMQHSVERFSNADDLLSWCQGDTRLTWPAPVQWSVLSGLDPCGPTVSYSIGSRTGLGPEMPPMQRRVFATECDDIWCRSSIPSFQLSGCCHRRRLPGVQRTREPASAV